MKKLVDGIVKIEEILCVALLVVMCVIIFVATVARFTQLFVIDWAEELARYCMIWAGPFWGSVLRRPGDSTSRWRPSPCSAPKRF